MNKIAQYNYKQWTRLLDGEIRLLKLHPGSESKALEVNLLVRSLKKTSLRSPEEPQAPEPEPFKALSYTWGPPAPKGQELYCYILTTDDDKEARSFRIEIKPNLEGALRQLRSPTENQFFWIDALCIDQKNNEEKSSQIPKMSNIYNRAEEVCIWLGAEEGDSAVAMQFIREELNLDNVDDLVKDPKLDEQWHALTTLMRRPWFSRRWIVQELARARNPIIYCGKDSIPWQDFADIVSLVSRKESEIREIFRQSSRYGHKYDHVGDLRQLAAVQLIYTSYNLFRKTDDGQILEHLMSLEGLMCSLTIFQASDPRDVLYAILWLAHDARPATKRVKAWDKHISSIGENYATANQPMSRLIIPQSGSYGSIASPMGSPNPVSAYSPLAGAHFDYFDNYNTEPEAVAGAGAEPVQSNLPNNTRKRTLSAVDGRTRIEVVRRRLSTVNGLTPSNRLQPPSFEGAAEPFPRWDQNEGTQADSDEPFNDNRPHTIVLDITDIDAQNAKQAEEKAKGMQMAAAAKGWLTAIRDRQIIVDYDKKVFDICKEFLEFTIQRSKSLDMICRPWAPNEIEGGELPSWIPKLTKEAFGLDKTGAYRRVNADPLVGKPGLTGKVYNASRSTRANVQWKRDAGCERSMFVQGFILDFVKDSFQTAMNGIVPSEWRKSKAVGWTDIEEPPPQRFWRTLVGNRDQYGQRPPPYWRSFCRAAFTSVPVGGELDTKELTAMKNCPSGQREILERIQSVVWKRRLVELSRIEGSLGLGPSEAKKGDVIVILYGCSVPVLLRKFVDGKRVKCKGYNSQDKTFWFKGQNESQSEGKVHYQFIGECFVDGMMDGEAFRTSDDFSYVKREIFFELK